MGQWSIVHCLVVLGIVVVIFGTKKLRNIGSDLGGAIKGFKEGIKEPAKDEATATTTNAEAAAPQRVATGETIDVQAKEKSSTH